MYKKLFIGLCTFVISITMFGCNTNSKHIYQTETIHRTSNLPDISVFSETEYENYAIHFSPVKSAFYRCNGIVEEIAIDDSRLIRLLNFIAYSSENMLDVWRQGYVLEDEINSYVCEDYAMLEVNFYNENGHSGSIIGDTPRIVVCGNNYLAFVDPTIENNSMEGVFAEQVFPYGELVTGNNSINSSDSNCWLNILEYTGF